MRLRLQFFSGGVAVPAAADMFGEGTGPILGTNFGCNGTEVALFVCPNSSIATMCTNRTIAAVRCQPESKI